jgi:hypothetical protein
VAWSAFGSTLISQCSPDWLKRSIGREVFRRLPLWLLSA